MKKKINFGLVVIAITSAVIYLSTQARTVVGGDAGDLLSAIATRGIPHPPGYPLYTFLGIIISRLFPFGSLAYKTGFLSSIPSVLTLVTLYFFLNRLTGKVLIPIISLLTVAVTNLYWQYSVQVEVFSLNNLFLSLLICCSYLFYLRAKPKNLYLLAFISGLSLSHHHLILFLIPSLLTLILPKFRKLKLINYLKAVIYFVSGLTPYFYTIVSANLNPEINWMGEANISNLFKLFTRAIYGTFTVGVFVGQQWWSRLANILGFFVYIWQDFTLIPVLLIISGMFYLFKRIRLIFRFFITAFLSYLFFLFYASFPLSDNFMLATFERFLLPLYILLSIPLCFGMITVEELSAHFINRYFVSFNRSLFLRVITATLLLFPLLLFIKNYRKISRLRDDFSAEYFAEDILNSLDKGSVIFISSDTPLFDSQYVYYSSSLYKDIKLVHFSKLFMPFYVKQLKRDYPDLNIESAIDGAADFVNILEANKKLQFYSQNSFDVASGRFVPWGLVYKYFPKDAEIDPKEVIKNNEILWQKYRDPEKKFSVYDNLNLNDIVRYYLLAHQETALYEAKNGEYKPAETHLQKAIALNNNDPDSYIILTQVYIKEEQCDKADMAIQELSNADKVNITINYLRYLNYNFCRNDRINADKWIKLYEENAKQKETPLKKL